MTFSKYNLNVLSESLFTELTTDQAQMLEGGKRIDILTVRCIKAGADSDGTDELFFTINGQNFRLGNPISIRTGGVANAGAGTTFSGNTANVGLFEKDGNSAIGANFIGGFIDSVNGTRTRRVSGAGSVYEVTYKVTN
ncbi:hypothetical protein [Chamaesiphon minutus]|uniref:Uncharacterized protein n=1 Tax=Chamaesiphon minutus (strain ATCC 27169 / PCC 6605) TaxID=1173020 RepID=K9UE06_CHAP6|nr:hypothetical protein [Chamaesiphon minutus]AFY93337.1 hypothetical protein Cha6605_2254 [Chamaesiphon minutus PCC 6605]